MTKFKIEKRICKLKALLGTASLLFTIGASALTAQEVTLRSVDGSLSMRGILTDFDGENYALESSIGQIIMSAQLVICEGEACPDLNIDLDEFTIAGSSTIGLQLMPALIESFAFDRGGELEVEVISAEQVKYTIFNADGEVYSTITLALGNSDDAFAALESGAAFIGLSSRRASEGERNRFLRNGKGDLTSAEQERILALDGLAIAVHPRNPIQTLSLDQISDIFAGNIRNWREVGGLNTPINVYRREVDAGATRVFTSLVMDPTRRSLARTAIIEGDNAAVANAVASDENGIGLTNVVDQGNAAALSLRSVCDQIASPTDFSIKTEEYPMSRRMFVYTTSAALPEKARELIEYMNSDNAQAVIENTGFMSQNVTNISLDDQGRRLAHALMTERDRTALELLQEMVAGLLDAERISLTFRFKSGSVDPDNRAIVDIERLATMVRNGDFDGKRLMIIGFADSIGAINENQRLSQARAESIRDVLVEAVGTENLGSVQFTPFGYGKLSPIGCNETEDGRDTNRRVEIWVR